MKGLLTRLLRGFAYLSAAIVILLAIAVGIFRLMLPRLPEYQEEIKGWASAALGMQVEFAGMNARWRFTGPELSFFDAVLVHDATGVSVLDADEVSIGVGLLRLVADRELVVDRVTIRGSTIDLRQDGNGEWILQGIPVDELFGHRPMQTGDIQVVGQDLKVAYEHPASGQLIPFTIRNVTVSMDDDVLAIESVIDLDPAFGRRLEVSANRNMGEGADDAWRFYIEADAFSVPGLARLHPFALPDVDSGTADFVMWFDYDDGHISSATANITVVDLHAIGDRPLSPIGLQGSFEFSLEPAGWLVGANRLSIDTYDGDWPQTSMQLRLERDGADAIKGLRGTASFVDLDDLVYLSAWLPADYRAVLDKFSPTGILRDLTFEFDGLQDEQPDFDVSAALERAGMAGDGERPGIREFTGRVRADRDGGRVEIDATDLYIDVGNRLPEPLVLDDAMGTIIWRRNNDGVIVLSDSIQIRNADFDAQASLQVSVPAGGRSPIIDVDANWSVLDVGAVHRYLPVRVIGPKLYEWLSSALVSGYVRYGTARFDGAVADFPFEDGSGIFRIDARLEDTVLRYSPNWPAPKFEHLDLVVENTRLYTEKNSAYDLGNVIEDAHVEIPDLRTPVLHIDTFATGTLQSIKEYASQSPISQFFGGQLDRVEVEGDASFDLEITLPIQDPRSYDFTTRIRTSEGTVRVAGFPPPITDLNGTVTITRDDIVSESLFATFLGSQVDLELARVADPASPHSVILRGNGRTTARALQAELGVPITGIVQGDMAYKAALRFPNARAVEPGPMQIAVTSDLYGLQVNLPEPVGKPDEEPLLLSASMEFPATDEITTAGSLGGELNWTGRFLNTNGGWDFDRGVIAIGEYPQSADVRGLHIHGQVAAISLEEWLAEGRRGDREVGLGDRIRRIDLSVDHLYAIGQRFTDHRIEVDRSGRDWLIRVSGKEASGVITVPYDFTAGRPMTLNMERLILPGDDSADPDAPVTRTDPRSLPAVTVHAGEFGLGERAFGELDVTFERTLNGLESTTLRTRDDSFTVTGSAGWIVDSQSEDGQRTFVNATLKSTDVPTTSQRLAYDPGIVSDAMQVTVDIGWPGGPRRDFMNVLAGDVSVSIGEGRLSEVDPGAGRMFGLMSITALPRRLSLDFSDVFESGFGYDKITGDFRIAAGDAYTCNLTLTGPAADVGIVGRAGLEARDYDQAAIVSANVGSTLPVAGLFLGGPQVAAALLVFSQVFKKPLKDVGQVFYTVQGSWDGPGVESADSQTFADVSGRAGCLAGR